MILFLFFLLSQRAGTCALPFLSPGPPEAPPRDPVFDIATTASTGACAGRSLWDILWSCLATTFACTWVSVHPNIPFLREGKASTRRWRVYLMFLSLIAPEIMLLWAFKQLQGALVIMKTVNNSYRIDRGAVDEKKGLGAGSGAETFTSDESTDVSGQTENTSDHNSENPLKWTLTHAHYLQMGGYRLQCLLSEEKHIPSRFGRSAEFLCAGRRYKVWELPLAFETMKTAFNEGLIDLPFIRKDEILDKNGRDGLSKAIAILQLTWFILQIAARARQNLAVTELELTTAALASLNIAMYVSWWSKPTDILCPTIVTTKGLHEQIQKWRKASLTSSTSADANGTSYNSISPEGTQSTVPRQITSSPSGDPEDSNGARMRYTIDKVGDKEKVNLAAHYWSEFTKALRESWRALSGFPGKLVTVIGEFVSELVKETSKIWSNPSVLIPSSNPHHLSDERSPSDEHSSSDHHVASRTEPFLSFFRKARDTICLLWKTITHLFLALIYYPILAILDSEGNRRSVDFVLNDDEVEKMATLKLIFNEEKLRSVMGMVFFCENVASAPFVCLSAFSGAIFGMIHCLAWNFEFPSLVEQVMWRTCSSIIAGLCICIMAISLVYIIIKIVKQIRNLDPTTHAIFDPKSTETVFSTFAIWFLLTRFSLLILSVIGLRNLPASAFETVQWSGFIPHI